jgi:hypothetical protein
VCVLGLACASGPDRVPDPRRTLDRFFAALQAERFDEAYALLHPDLQSQLDPKRFVELAKQNRTELLALAKQLEQTRTESLVHAQVSTDRGESVTVVLEDGGYKIASGVLDAHALHTPLDAVAELRRALLRQHLPSILRVLSAERRAAFMAAFERNLAHTEDPLDLRVEVSGDSAIVVLSDESVIELRRQGGTWHVHDVRAPAAATPAPSTPATPAKQ